MGTKSREITYFGLFIVTTLVAIIVLNYSMNEPFCVVTKADLIWQLIIPSAFLSCSFAGIPLGLFGRFQVRKIMLYGMLLVFLFDLLIFTEAIYGYLWDLKNHVGIK